MLPSSQNSAAATRPSFFLPSNPVQLPLEIIMVTGRKLKWNSFGANPSLFFFIFPSFQTTLGVMRQISFQLTAKEGSLDFKVLESKWCNEVSGYLNSPIQIELFVLNSSGHSTAQTQLYKGCVHYNVKLTKKVLSLPQLGVYLKSFWFKSRCPALEQERKEQPQELCTSQQEQWVTHRSLQDGGMEDEACQPGELSAFCVQNPSPAEANEKSPRLCGTAFDAKPGDRLSLHEQLTGTGSWERGPIQQHRYSFPAGSGTTAKAFCSASSSTIKEPQVLMLLPGE